MKTHNQAYDVVVIGAGAAGIAAAVAATASGAKVILVECYGFVGGLATSAMVGTVCGLYYRNMDTPVYAVQGFARQFAEGLKTKSHTQSTIFAEGLHFLPYQISTFHQQGIEELKRAEVHLLLHSQVIEVNLSQGQITRLVVQNNEGILHIHPSAVIDCSGHAHISLLADIECITAPSYQTGAFVFQVAGLPNLEPRLLGLNLIRSIERGIQHGNLEPECRYVSIVPGTVKKGLGLFKLGLLHAFKNTAEDWTDYELNARQRSVTIIDYLYRSDRLFSDLCIVTMATQVGIRTSTRSKGIEQLNEKQVLNCAKPDNGVAVGAWPIEYWGEGDNKPQMHYFNFNDCYWIPAGALVSDSLTNLFFAGRTLSATEQAIASARVIGTCLNTGYAAGLLANEFIQHGQWQSAIEKIQIQHILTPKASRF